MYLVAYVIENYGVVKDIFFDYIDVAGISDKENTAQAIWQVGKGLERLIDLITEINQCKIVVYVVFLK